MVWVIDENEEEDHCLVRERFHQEEVSIEHLSLEEEIVHDKLCKGLEIDFDEDAS